MFAKVELTRHMNGNHIYVLIHSPLVGALTWELVADEMRRRGLNAVVPILKDSPDSREPFWKQHAESISRTLLYLPKDTAITLVGHSGAGPLLPAIRQSIAGRVEAYVFVDAGIPRGGASRLELMRSEDPEWAKQLEAELMHGGRFPNWRNEDLREVIPDEALRKRLVAEMHPRRLEFFTEPIPVFSGWPDAPCIYIQFSTPYEEPAAQARQAGWATYKIDAGHFHMLVDAVTVMNLIVGP